MGMSRSRVTIHYSSGQTLKGRGGGKLKNKIIKKRKKSCFPGSPWLELMLPVQEPWAQISGWAR